MIFLNPLISDFPPELPAQKINPIVKVKYIYHFIAQHSVSRYLPKNSKAISTM